MAGQHRVATQPSRLRLVLVVGGVVVFLAVVIFMVSTGSGPRPTASIPGFGSSGKPAPVSSQSLQNPVTSASPTQAVGPDGSKPLTTPPREVVTPAQPVTPSNDAKPREQTKPPKDAKPSKASKPSKDGPAQSDAPAAPPAVAKPAPPLPKPLTVPIDKPADLTPAVSAQIASIEQVTAKGMGPGELSGPALKVSLILTNSGATSLDLSTTVVTVDTLDGAPASAIESDVDAAPFHGVLAAGKTLTGSYLFLAPAQGEPIRVSFSTSTEQPVVLFSGSPSAVGKTSTAATTNK